MPDVNTQAPALPDPKAAYDALSTGPRARVFFSTLASRGFAPRNEKEAADLLALAGQLAQAGAAQPAEPESRFATPLGDLVRLTKTAGDGRDAELHNAAALFARDPVLYNSVLALRATQADLLAS